MKFVSVVLAAVVAVVVLCGSANAAEKKPEYQNPEAAQLLEMARCLKKQATDPVANLQGVPNLQASKRGFSGYYIQAPNGRYVFCPGCPPQQPAPPVAPPQFDFPEDDKPEVPEVTVPPVEADTDLPLLSIAGGIAGAASAYIAARKPEDEDADADKVKE